MGVTFDSRKPSSQRGYDHRWTELRAYHISQEPLCRHCRERGLTRAAEEVDHIEPISKRPDLRLEPTNLQSLCRRCHVRKTREENNGQTRHESLVRIVTGLSVCDCQRYITERSIPGELVWNVHDIAAAIGFKQHTPKDVGKLIAKWWRCLERTIASKTLNRDLWLIVPTVEMANNLAVKLLAELIDLTPTNNSK